jgi:hypothetical protein
VTKNVKKALVAAGKLAIAATKLLRGKDDKEKVEGFSALPTALDNYDRTIIGLMYTAPDEEPLARAKADSVTIDYTNHRGIRGIRRIRPISLQLGVSTYHPNEWVVVAFDEDKQEERCFALRCIHGWGSP